MGNILHHFGTEVPSFCLSNSGYKNLSNGKVGRYTIVGIEFLRLFGINRQKLLSHGSLLLMILIDNRWDISKFFVVVESY